MRTRLTSSWSGARRPGPAELKERQDAITAEAAELEKLAATGFREIVARQLEVEAVFSRLLPLGTRAPDALVSTVAQALTAVEPRPHERAAEGRLEDPGCEITWPRIRTR